LDIVQNIWAPLQWWSLETWSRSRDPFFFKSRSRRISGSVSSS